MKFKVFLLFLFFTPLSFAGNAEDVKILTEDGWQLNAKWFKPVKNNNVFLLIHSQKKNLFEWKKWFVEIERYGYGYLAIDLRGHGLSTISPEGSNVTYKSFSVDGLNNEYNKMIRDIDASVVWLSSNGVTENRIVLVGSWLGANLAIKYAAINKNIPMVVAIFPSLNINDVRTVEPIRTYDRPILFIVGSNYSKKYAEFQIMNGLAKNSTGKFKTLSIVEKNITNADSFSLNLIRRIIEWTQNPFLPETIEYNINISTAISTVVNISTQSSKGELEEFFQENGENEY